MLFSSLVFAQNSEVEFPVPLRPGVTFTIPAGYDTLFWLLKNTQFEKAQNVPKIAEIDRMENVLLKKKIDLLGQKVLKQQEKISLLELKIDKLDEKNGKLGEQIGKLNEIIKEQDEIANLNYQGYIHYRDLWKETDLKLEKEEIKSLNRTRLAVLGFAVATLAITGAIFFNN